MNASEAITEASVPGSPGNIAGLLMRVSSIGERCQMASFDPTTPRGRQMLVKATLLDPTPLKEMIGKTIAVTDFYAHDAGKTDDDGECEEWTRIVIFDDQQNAYACGARGVAKALAVLIFARNQVHFDPPIKCEVKLRQLANTKQWLTLIPDLASLGVDSVAKPTGKPGK